MNGILFCKKPTQITSNKIVRNIAKKYKIKAGNTGILDYAASGLLVILVEKGTKFTQFFQNLDKEYIAIGELGKETDTYDINGNIIREKNVDIDEETLINIIKSFKGKQLIIPPIYSSKKVDGKRAYKYALKGENINLKPIEVEIYDIEVLNVNLPFFTIKVHCSSGTYIRSLIKDIGEKANTFAYVYSLERTKIGKFSINDSIEYEKLINFSEEQFRNSIIPIEKALYFFPEYLIEIDNVNRFKNGQKIIFNKYNFKQFVDNEINLKYYKNYLKIFDNKKNFLGLASLDNGFIQPKLVL